MGQTTNTQADPAGTQWTRYAPRPEPLREGMKYHVFLSYRSVNRPWVINLYDVLRAHGYEVFLDQCTLVAGSELITELQAALRTSQAGVLVWSRATGDSKWVNREFQTMLRRTDKGGFHFVPVVLDATDLPEFAENLVYVDFSQYPDGPNGGELLRLLHAITGKPLSPDAAHFATEQNEAAHEAAADIKSAIANGSAERLRKIALAGGPAWETSSALGCAAAEGLTKLGAYDAALEVLVPVERRFPRAVRPKQLRALALARRAAKLDHLEDLEEAQAILGRLEALGENDPETLGILARTWTDRYQRSKEVLHLRRSRDLYARAFAQAHDDYYTGINAAAKSVLLGIAEEIAAGQALAAKLQEAIGTVPVARDYWKTATVAEAHLIRGDYAKAAEVYAAAVAMASEERGSHESTWQQACRLMAVLQPTADARAAVRRAFAHLSDCT